MSQVSGTPLGTLRIDPVVYILASQRNGTLYVGASSDFVGRIGEHKQELIDGFTKRHGVHRLVYFERHESLEDAFAREKKIKRWRRAWKIALIESMNSRVGGPILENLRFVRKLSSSTRHPAPARLLLAARRCGNQ